MRTFVPPVVGPVKAGAGELGGPGVGPWTGATAKVLITR